ncbi:PIN domain-containing protein [Microbacterium thalassium]|uniref:Putative nucleic acid-binding protein n=1 Tax=Microbacterium thalassium TaxID=362649 RepID=A0A7X0FLL5_9MICO|nr:PIN domain-containing protein [Microbacterium thalassium]MBB6389736.1 putative nucleic acid-binding protein [Microbacterium thalassium]GLK24420.1 PIN domain-containing protein [Microbacterium thalassium]
MFTATLDTSVLWPSLQRDFLLSLAIEGAYRPTWSSAILDELEFHEEAKLVKRGMPVTKAAGRAATLIAAMRREFADAEVEGWEPLEGTFGLPDPDDEHVVAAAVIAGAGAIVTENLKDFPTGKIPPGIQLLSATEFAKNTVALNPRHALAAVQEIASRSGRYGSALTVEEILDTLRDRYGMIEAVEMMVEAASA